MQALTVTTPCKCRVGTKENRKMNLKEALEKFEAERQSKRDYCCVGWRNPRNKYGLSPIYDSQIKRCENIDVVNYNEFKGHVITLSLTGSTVGESECRAVDIEIDADQVMLELYPHMIEKPIGKFKLP